MEPWADTLGQAEVALQQLEEVTCHVRGNWPAFGNSTNGSASDGSSTLESLRRLAELSDMVGRCEVLLPDAKALVEAAWRNLDAGKLSDWDVAGRCVLGLLDKQAESIGNAAELLRQIMGHVVRFVGLPATDTVVAELLNQGLISGLTGQELERLTAGLSQLLTVAQDFRDSWPWSTGNKPDDEEGAATAQRVLQALPPFEVLARMAVKFPPPPEWFQGE